MNSGMRNVSIRLATVLSLGGLLLAPVSSSVAANAQGASFGASDGWMPYTSVQSAQECDQITLRATNRPDPVHIQNSCAHYRVSG
jgi:hypothetical protein